MEAQKIIITGGATRIGAAIARSLSGINKDIAKEIVKDLKGNFKKIQSSIQDGSIRVSGKKRDELQEVISFIKSNDYNIYLNYGNFRD